MENIWLILCFVCIILKSGTALSSEDNTNSNVSDEPFNKVGTKTAEDLEGAETVGKLFNLKGIFPSYGTNPSYPPGRYPSTSGGYYPTSGGGYYPSSSGGYYPSSSGGYYPSSSGGYYPSYKPTNGYYPSSENYPNTGYYPSGSGSSGSYPSSGTNILGHGTGSYPSQSFYPSSNPWYRTSSDYGVTGSSSYGGYGGYGGNGALNSYNGYNNPRYDGKRNLGYGYHSDTDRYGFYKSPSQQLSVYRGYD